MKALVVLLTVCCGLQGVAHADATYVVSEAAAAYESNLGHSEHSSDIQEDSSLIVGANLSHSFLLGNNSGLVLSADAKLKEQARFDGLSQLTLGVRARYRVQPVAGFTAPWIELAAGAERLQYRDSEIRDGWLGDFAMTIGKHFTDRLQMSAGFSLQRRYAEQSNVFDLYNQQISLSADYKPTGKLTIYASAAHIYGDQVSTASVPPIGKPLANYAKAIADDTALEKHGDSRKAYRISANTNTFELGLNYALRGDTALDVSVLQFNSNADGGHSYDGWTARAGFLYRF